MNKLFVYGTLKPGECNHDVMRDIPGTWEAASMKGTLYHDGWGAVHGCPGIVPSSDGDTISGFVFTSTELDRHWDRLDAFEGDDYSRVHASVTLNTGEQVRVFVYAISGALRDLL